MESVVLNDRYRLLELIGSGGMAVVYRGIDTLLQRRVAVKVLREGFAGDPSFLARFQREARAAANLDHPNIVTVYDVGQDGDRHYIVMEHVDGQDLKTRIRQKGRLGVHEALDIAAQISDGVGHAHQSGIVHCDIKPQNVLVTHDGRAKVTDFGIARALSESGVTESETVWGSPLYFSPEQAAGDPPSPASDVYSIGVVLYEMLAGEPPFQAENPTALALMHIREEPPPLAVRNPNVPSQLEWIVRKVLAKEPSARYRTAEQLGLVLEEYRKQAEQRTGWQPAVPSIAPVPQIPVDYPAEPEPPPPLASKVLPAWLDWVLGGIAFVAVLGLIPVWLSVYRAYSVRPSLPPTPTTPPLVTLPPDVPTVAVPRLVGVPVEEARALVERAGLRFVVREERDESGAKPGVVLEQDPAPDQAAPVDSDVSVVVNRPPRELQMPAVVNYPVEIVQDGLESDGLEVRIDPVWSQQPVGMVLAQEPERGIIVYAGDTVTLTVSGGVDVSIPIEANLAELVVLESAELQQDSFRAGEVIAVTLRWRALRAIGDTHYIVFVHLIDPDASPQDSLVAQQDIEPVPPTSAWKVDVDVFDVHQVTIPSGLRAGRYELRTGMYSRGQPGFRLPVVDAGATTAESDSILVAEIEIRP